MTATCDTPDDFGGTNYASLLLWPATRRRTRDGRTAHLFIAYSNGAVSGIPLPLCDPWPCKWSLPARPVKWQDCDDASAKLCNNCARAFRLYRKRRTGGKWAGEP